MAPATFGGSDVGQLTGDEVAMIGIGDYAEQSRRQRRPVSEPLDVAGHRVRPSRTFDR